MTIPPNYSPEEIALIKQRFPADLTESEFQQFMARARNAGLCPLRRQIMALAHRQKGSSKKAMTVIVTIDGFRALAYRADPGHGTTIKYLHGDEQWKMFPPLKALPIAAMCTVMRGTTGREVSKIAMWAEHGAGKAMNWTSMPAHMLGKVAEGLALRSAFPLELSGLYSDDEISEPSPTPTPTPSPTPTPTPTPAPPSAPAQGEITPEPDAYDGAAPITAAQARQLREWTKALAPAARQAVIARMQALNKRAEGLTVDEFDTIVRLMDRMRDAGDPTLDG